MPSGRGPRTFGLSLQDVVQQAVQRHGQAGGTAPSRSVKVESAQGLVADQKGAGLDELLNL